MAIIRGQPDSLWDHPLHTIHGLPTPNQIYSLICSPSQRHPMWRGSSHTPSLAPASIGRRDNDSLAFSSTSSASCVAQKAVHRLLGATPAESSPERSPVKAFNPAATAENYPGPGFPRANGTRATWRQQRAAAYGWQRPACRHIWRPYAQPFGRPYRVCRPGTVCFQIWAENIHAKLEQICVYS